MGERAAVPAATLCRFGGLSAELSCAGVKGCLPQMQVRWLAAEVEKMGQGSVGTHQARVAESGKLVTFYTCSDQRVDDLSTVGLGRLSHGLPQHNRRTSQTTVTC